MKWARRRVLVTGGAGFIGSHLVDKLLGLGADVFVVDYDRFPSDIWDMKMRNLNGILRRHGVNGEAYFDVDLEAHRITDLLRKNTIDTVFHLACVFGGRLFVDTRQAECCRGFGINHNVVSSSRESGVKHIHFASSACVYPNSLNKPDYLLKEDDAISTGEGFRSSDNSYGWVKLMGELELKSYYEEYGLEGSTARYLTVFGPWEYDESHAIAALTKRATGREDPFTVWGSGDQERGFTYVADIVDGTISCAEKIRDVTPVNLGSDKRYSIREVAELIVELVGYKPRMAFDRSKPEGPKSRALDISRARQLLGWEPKVSFRKGLSKTVEWIGSRAVK